MLTRERGVSTYEIPRKIHENEPQPPQMDADTFMNQNQPGRRTSRLEAHRVAIHKLHAAGYTLAQIRDYLATHSISISVSVLSRFIRGANPAVAEETATQPATQARVPSLSGPSPNTTSSQPSGVLTKTEIAASNPAFTPEQVTEAWMAQFSSANPLHQLANKA